MAEASLADSLRRLIRNLGPVSVQQFMGESNARYYASRDPLGAAGDFVTAPEISQMFGEMIGLWCADLALRALPAGAPLRYVELGPGRGTLARDALRVLRRQGLDPQVHFVEASPALGALQAEAVGEATWHADLSTLPDDGPLLIVGNEFLDALPIRQIVRTPSGWRERMVAMDEAERFVAVAGDKPMDAAIPPKWQGAPEGTLLETCPGAVSVVREISRRLAMQGGAALLIDYGHDAPRSGSTLQALKSHRKVDPFDHPGEADLTAHVDFHALAAVGVGAGAIHAGTVGQGAFLSALGIGQRAAALAAASPARADEIAVAHRRLVDDAEMGSLFKVMGLAAPDWPQPAGFA